jgi:hypothetical protein
MSFEVFLKTKFNQSTSIIIYISFNLKVFSLITNQSHLKYLNLQAFIQLITKQNVNLPMLLSSNPPHKKVTNKNVEKQTRKTGDI